MSQARICDNCGKVEKREMIGWIHTEAIGRQRWVGSVPEEPHDFCSRGCVVAYYTAPEVVHLAARPHPAQAVTPHAPQ